jgi:hypothetical protein
VYAPPMAATEPSAPSHRQTQTQQKEETPKPSSQSTQLNITSHYHKPLIGNRQAENL